ncbi:hypothetical protein GCM10015534_41300 [Streptomyces diastaticus subsp. diastaticus]|nr:hypothetical protein GCM10015534_41300 [Streptomyces diastaticus subsp. diastaticus]
MRGKGLPPGRRPARVGDERDGRAPARNGPAPGQNRSSNHAPNSSVILVCGSFSEAQR